MSRRPVAVALALALLGACERAGPPPEPTPPSPPLELPRPPVHARATAVIRYAAKTQPRYSGENNNYFSIVEDGPLFVIADAGDPAASQRAAETIEVYPPVGCTPRRDPDETELWCAIERANTALIDAHQTASVAAVIVRERESLIAIAGDVPVVLRHGARTELLAPRVAAPALGTERRVRAELRWVPFTAGDTLLLVDRGLVAAVGVDRVRAAAAPGAEEKTELEAVVAGLVDAGGAVRDHLEQTALIVHLVPRR